jgi:hypothetical protein
MSYVEIEKFKFDKYLKYNKMLKEYSEFKILSNNEVKYYSFIICIDAWLF